MAEKGGTIHKLNKKEKLLIKSEKKRLKNKVNLEFNKKYPHMKYCNIIIGIGFILIFIGTIIFYLKIFINNGISIYYHILPFLITGLIISIFVLIYRVIKEHENEDLNDVDNDG